MPLTDEQIAARQHGVGCSEILAALGKDSRCTRLELYMRKRGELPELDLDDDPRVHFGNVLEPVILDEMGRRLNTPIMRPNQTVAHPDAPLLGHPDGWFPKIEDGAEAKAADKFEADDFGEPESDQVPIRYLVQCAGYLALHPHAQRWRLGVLIGGNDFRMYEIERDPQLEEAILAGVAEFWGHVAEGRPPDPMTPEDVRLRWPKHLQPSVVASGEIEARVHEHAEMKAMLKAAERREAEVKAAIQQYMAEAGDLVDGQGETLATWRSARPSQKFDAKAFREAHPELYEQFLVEQPGSRRFLNKLTKQYEEKYS